LGNFNRAEARIIIVHETKTGAKTGETHVTGIRKSISHDIIEDGQPIITLSQM
jgi:hypothetical protein